MSTIEIHHAKLAVYVWYQYRNWRSLDNKFSKNFFFTALNLKYKLILSATNLDPEQVFFLQYYTIDELFVR